MGFACGGGGLGGSVEGFVARHFAVVVGGAVGGNFAGLVGFFGGVLLFVVVVVAVQFGAVNFGVLR